MREAWDRCAFPGTFRRYQSLALDAVEQLSAAGERRAYLVLPPGAGKTVLGLEVARRIGRRTLVLTPNTAVQAQWLAEWKRFGGEGGHPRPASAERALTAPMSVLTYQALTVWDRSADDEDVEDDGSADPRRDAAGRRCAARRARTCCRCCTRAAASWCGARRSAGRGRSCSTSATTCSRRGARWSARSCAGSAPTPGSSG